MIEKIISDSFNIKDRMTLEGDRKELDFNREQDLAYLRYRLKRMIHQVKGQGKHLHLIASDGNATIIDIDSFLSQERENGSIWQVEIIEIIQGFKEDMESFGLEFSKIKLL